MTSIQYSPGARVGGLTAESPQQDSSPVVEMAQVCSALAETAEKEFAQLEGLGTGDWEIDIDGDIEIEKLVDGVTEAVGVVDSDGVGDLLAEVLGVGD